MKQLGLLISFILTISMQTLAQRQGGESSGGGGGFVCRNKAGVATSVELLDLWESPFVFGWTPQNSTLPYEQQIDAAVAKLKIIYAIMGLDIEAAVSLVKSQMAAVPQGVSVPTPTDTGHLFEKPGCPFEGLMYYSGTYSRLFYVNDYFKLLSETHKAAMIMHEAIYYFLRDYLHDTDSMRSRKIVACLFSPDCTANITAASLTKNMVAVYHCDNANISYDVYAPKTTSTPSMVKIIFNKLSGINLSKSSVLTIPAIEKYSHNTCGIGAAVDEPNRTITPLTITNDNLEGINMNNHYSYSSYEVRHFKRDLKTDFIELEVNSQSDFNWTPKDFGANCTTAYKAKLPLTCKKY